MAAWDTKVLWSFTFLLAGETQSASSSFVLLPLSLLLKTTNKQEEISGDTKVTAGLVLLYFRKVTEYIYSQQCRYFSFTEQRLSNQAIFFYRVINLVLRVTEKPPERKESSGRAAARFRNLSSCCVRNISVPFSPNINKHSTLFFPFAVKQREKY